jgi:hypothetical protein
MTIHDFPSLHLGDKRRSDRFVKIIDGIVRQPGSSIPKLSNTWYDTKATYEFFKNKEISLKNIISGISAYGASQIDEQKILVIHDTSTISYNDLQAEGLGYIDNANGRGIFCHSSMAATLSGIPLGLLHQLIWSRKMEELGKSANRKQKLFEQKESYKWYQGIEAANELLPSLPKIHIADREADIYQLFIQAREPGCELLIRARQNRKTADCSDLWKYVGEQKVAAQHTLIIPDKTGKRKKQVTVQLRYAPVELHCSVKQKNPGYQKLLLTAIDIKQNDNTADGIHWKLLTTIAIDNAQQALQCMHWYSYRWLIERFHFVLKSGCGIESLQLKNAQSLIKAIAIYSLAAFKIMTLAYQSRNTPQATCEVLLTRQQWQTLYMLKHKTHILPHHPPSLLQVTIWIAQMGGYLNRKSDGPPGLKTIWLGYEILNHATNLFSIFKKNLGKD